MRTANNVNRQLLSALQTFVNGRFTYFGGRVVGHDVRLTKADVDFAKAAIAAATANDAPTLIDGVTEDLLEGLGASEDHEMFLGALRGAGLSKATADKLHRRVFAGAERPTL